MTVPRWPPNNGRVATSSTDPGARSPSQPAGILDQHISRGPEAVAPVLLPAHPAAVCSGWRSDTGARTPKGVGQLGIQLIHIPVPQVGQEILGGWRIELIQSAQRLRNSAWETRPRLACLPRPGAAPAEAETGEWPPPPERAEWPTLNVVSARITALRARVLDEELRRLVRELQTSIWSAVEVSDWREQPERMQAARDPMNRMQERVNLLLKELFKASRGLNTSQRRRGCRRIEKGSPTGAVPVSPPIPSAVGSPNRPAIPSPIWSALLDGWPYREV